MITALIEQCNRILPIPAEASDAYAASLEALVANVNSQMESNPDILRLIGNNPLELMRNNHHNHALFMASVFKLNSFELLVRTIPWVYRAYHARGFTYEYFPVELVAWQCAILEQLNRVCRIHEIMDIYKWMVEHHEEMIHLSLDGTGLGFSVTGESIEMQEICLALLLNGDTKGCLKLVDQSINGADDIKRFYLDVLSPALYRVGTLWESNQISVAEEHVATAIVARVMAALYPQIANVNTSRGKAVVTACPNEFHEVGARMLADFMEMDGWDVSYLGANTPAAGIVGMLKREKPFVVALSVATVFNLENARMVIDEIRSDQDICMTKILVGGLAFNSVPELWKNIGADGCASDAEKALAVLNLWSQENSQ